MKTINCNAPGRITAKRVVRERELEHATPGRTQWRSTFGRVLIPEGDRYNISVTVIAGLQT
jgi:hypothetical protein